MYYLVTRNAGSLITSAPTRTCPCSISWVAILMPWLILFLTITTGNLLLQKQLAVTCWVRDKSHFVDITPIMYNFSSSNALCSILNGWSGSSALIFCPISRISRASLLYLYHRNKKKKTNFVNTNSKLDSNEIINIDKKYVEFPRNLFWNI